MRLLDDDAPVATVADYEAALARRFGPDADAVRALYPATDTASTVEALSRIFTDAYFGANARFAVASQRSLGQPAWLYQFTRTPPGERARVGAIHGADVQFTFDALLPIGPANDYDTALARTMGDQLVAFARTGDPNTDTTPHWPVYDPNEPQWMEWGERLDANRVMRASAYDVFDRVRARRAASLEAD